LQRLTLKEKISLFSGKKLFWTNSVKRLGIPPLKMTDGPNGVGTGVLLGGKMTYFPGAICRAATWNPKLSVKFGIAIAQEVRSVGRQILLAPGINIQRTPLCGRTFEYQTEDPYLNKILGVSTVKGVQSQKIAACVKHYITNNQEFNRFKISSNVSERALREIYFPGFEACVKQGDVWAVMACYNKINGIFGCEHQELLRNILIEEWNFRGFIVSDWFATRYTDTVKCIKAGLTLEMPGNVKFIPKNQAFCYHPKKIKKALEKDLLNEKELDDNLRRLLRVMFLVGNFDKVESLPQGSKNTPVHQQIAREIAEEGMVLLKNKKELLPLNLQEIEKIAILGPNARKKMAFGGGSSIVRALYEITPYKGLKKKSKNKFKITSSAENADAIVLCVGLNHKKFFDSENKDRLYLELPSRQEKLIKKMVKKNPNTIVVIISGSPIAMENWIEDVPSVVQAWYAGMEGGNVLADVIFGDVNPSGKLPITFPKKLSDSPAHSSYRSYPGLKRWENIKEGDLRVEKKDFRVKYSQGDEVYYDEGVFVGYRHFDKHDIDPLFCFGHGLSYTSFSYSNLIIDKTKITKGEQFTVSLEITNSGNRLGSEVVQLYVQDVESSVDRPIRELKGFQKIRLEPGEKKSISFQISPNDLSFYDEISHSWKVEAGEFKIHIGSSSRDIRLTGSIIVL
ncbi:MAG: beta-glucosidase, partial [Promethearchaeota archaeon]